MLVLDWLKWSCGFSSFNGLYVCYITEYNIFSRADPSLHPWEKSHLVTIYITLSIHFWVLLVIISGIFASVFDEEYYFFLLFLASVWFGHITFTLEHTSKLFLSQISKKGNLAFTFLCKQLT